MKKVKEHLVRHQAQLAALAAAARQEVVDVLAELGTVSVAELAAALGRPADALYFHLRALVRVGLVEKVGHRSRAGGKEALFRTVAPELMLKYEPHKASNRKAVSAIVASMLRLGIRDFHGAFQPGNAIVSGPQRELWALRKAGRLSLPQLAGVNRSIRTLTKAFSAESGHGRLYAITILLTPLDHRNKIDKAPKSKGKTQ